MMNNAVEKAQAFNGLVRDIRKELSIEIDERTADKLGLTVEQLRMKKRLVHRLLDANDVIRAHELERSGMTVSEIAHEFDKGESWARYVLSEDEDVAAASIEIYAKKLGFDD